MNGVGIGIGIGMDEEREQQGFLLCTYFSSWISNSTIKNTIHQVFINTSRGRQYKGNTPGLTSEASSSSSAGLLMLMCLIIAEND
jgi:hypothetical protein